MPRDVWDRRLASLFWFGVGVGLGSVALGMLTLGLYEPLQLPFGERFVFVRVTDFAGLSLRIAIVPWFLAAVADAVRRLRSRRGESA